MAAHLVRKSVVAGLLDQIEMLGSARFDDVRGEVQVPLLAGPVVQSHEGFQQRAGFDVARFVADVGGAPAQIDDFRLGRMSYLRDEAVGVFFQRLEYGGVLFDPAIVFIQSEHDVLALPQVAVLPAGLLLFGRTADTAVGILYRKQVFDRRLQDAFEFRVLGVSVKHAARAHRFAPHFAEGELGRSLGTEKFHEFAVGQFAFVPMFDRVPDVVFEKIGQPDGACRKRREPVRNGLRRYEKSRSQ